VVYRPPVVSVLHLGNLQNWDYKIIMKISNKQILSAKILVKFKVPGFDSDSDLFTFHISY
jgi:hypothetical protein